MYSYDSSRLSSWEWKLRLSNKHWGENDDISSHVHDQKHWKHVAFNGNSESLQDEVSSVSPLEIPIMILSDIFPTPFSLTGMCKKYF